VVTRSKNFNTQKAATGITKLTVFKWQKPSTPTYFKRQNRRYLLSSNGKTADIYCLQMVEPLTSSLFKWQNQRNLLSSNDNPVGTYGKTVNTYRLQTAKMSHLLSSNG